MVNFNSQFKNNATGSIGLSFVKVYNQWHKQIKEVLTKIKITHPQFVVLASLAYLNQNQAEVNQVDIAQQSGIDVMTVSTVLKNLEKKQLVIRQVSAKDTRAKIIKLTKAGQNKVNEATPLVEQKDDQFFACLDQDKVNFNRLLLKIAEKNQLF